MGIKSVPVRQWLHVSSNTQAAFEAQFVKKLSNTETKFKKRVKKGCIQERNPYLHFTTTTETWCQWQRKHCHVVEKINKSNVEFIFSIEGRHKDYSTIHQPIQKYQFRATN